MCLYTDGKGNDAEERKILEAKSSNKGGRLEFNANMKICYYY